MHLISFVAVSAVLLPALAATTDRFDDSEAAAHTYKRIVNFNVPNIVTCTLQARDSSIRTDRGFQPSVLRAGIQDTTESVTSCEQIPGKPAGNKNCLVSFFPPTLPGDPEFGWKAVALNYRLTGGTSNAHITFRNAETNMVSSMQKHDVESTNVL